MIAFCSRVPAIAMLLVLVTGVPARPAAATPLGTAFTYQGQLEQSGAPANGSCDMLFSLFGAASGGRIFSQAPLRGKLLYEWRVRSLFRHITREHRHHADAVPIANKLRHLSAARKRGVVEMGREVDGG